MQRAIAQTDVCKQQVVGVCSKKHEAVHSLHCQRTRNSEGGTGGLATVAGGRRDSARTSQQRVGGGR